MTRTCDLGKLEIGGQFLADAGDSLGGGVYGEQLGLPVGHHAVRFQRRMGLHLGVVTGIHHHVGVFESLLGVAVFAYRRPVNIACLGNTVRASSSSRGCGLIGRSGENLRRVGFPSLVHIDHEGQGFVLHLDLGCGFFRCLGSGGRDSGDRLPGIAHGGVLRNIERRVAQYGAAEERFNHVHALHPGRAFGCGSVDGENLRVRHCGVDEAGVEHARQLHVGGIAGAAGDLGVTIPALGRFADVVEIFVDRQHRRLRGRYSALFLMQGVAGDADGHTDSLLRNAGTVGSSREERVSERDVWCRSPWWFLLRLAGHLVGCVEGGGENFGVGAAAADVAGDGVAHVGFRGMGILLEQRGAAHDHTRRTETALHGIMTDEGSLHGMQLVAGREAFDGGDLVTDRIEGQRHAAVDGHLIEPYGTAGAGATVATDFGAGHAGLDTQGIRQGGARLDR